jgi:hypothetical protein
MLLLEATQYGTPVLGSVLLKLHCWFIFILSSVEFAFYSVS